MRKSFLALLNAVVFLLVASVSAQQTEVVPDGNTTQAAEAKYVLGKLGQVVTPAKVRSRPGKGTTYYRTKKNEYLVVKPDPSGKYDQVLLSNGVWGYVAPSTVTLLPYTVKSNAEIKPGRAHMTMSSRSRAALASYARNFTGTPYVWGGNSLTQGVDCSGFVKNLYGKIGLNLPRTAAEQMKVGTPITRYEDLRPGDRLYFWENGHIGHTGMYSGGGYFIHSSRGRHGVATDYLTPKWRKILIAARR